MDRLFVCLDGRGKEQAMPISHSHGLVWGGDDVRVYRLFFFFPWVG